MPKQKGGGEKERSNVLEAALRPPDREEYERAMADVMEQMRQKQAQLKSLQHVRASGDSSPQLQKQTPAVEGGPGENLTPEKERLLKEKSEVVEEQKRVEHMLRQISSDISDKKEQSLKLRANLQYTKEDAYDSAIKKLQEQLLCDNSESEAKKLEEEVNKLRLSKQNLRVYVEIEGTVVQLKKEQEGMRDRRNGLYRQLSVIKGKERSYHQQSSPDVAAKGTSTAALRATLREEIDVLNHKRQQLIHDFKRTQDDYLVEREVERERGRQERERKVEEKKLKEVEKKSRETLLKKSGEDDESGLLAKETAEKQAGVCSTLISYLRRTLKTKDDGGGGVDSSSNGSPRMGGTLHAEVQDGAVQQTQGAVRKDWPDDKPGVYIKKKVGAEEQYYTPKPLQRRRSKKEKMKSATAPKVTTRLHLSPLMLEQFAVLKLHPPATLGDVPATLELLQQKMTSFQTLLRRDLQGGVDSGIVSVEHSDSEVALGPDSRFDF